MKPAPTNEIGNTYTRLTVLEFDSFRGQYARPYWKCQCVCGTLTTVGQAQLRKGDTKSCGCYHREKIRQVKTSLAERFWTYTQKAAGHACWTWTGYKNAQGYGKLFDRPHEVMSGLAHRISWRLHFGEIPNDLHVLHRCDNPACVNPNHLFLGTNADNVRDKVAKGRQGHPNAKLSEAFVATVKALYLAGVRIKDLDRRFGIACTRICRGSRWQSVMPQFELSLPRVNL